MLLLLALTARADDPIDLGSVRDISDLELEDLLTPMVVSASRTVEEVSQAPVPVTVITAPMLRAIGARTLKDALEAYVPGITNVADHNELNVAMRGVYASAQQKILVLVDGHRLNSRAYNQAAPDFSISVDPAHIQQIEVLRGPGSSIYGNVALTAVVNIVTRDGADVDGLVVRAGAGDHWQRHATATFGDGLGEDGDVLLWASVHRAAGERVPIARSEDFSADPHRGEAIVGGDRDPGSYDVGVSLQKGDLRLYGQTRYGKHTEPFTAAGPTGAVYDHDDMRTLMGTGPGLGSRSHHLELGWTPQLTGDVDLDLAAYYDGNQIIGQTTTGWDTHIGLGWQENVQGTLLQGRGRYSALGDGMLLIGAQIETFEVADSWLLSGERGDWDLVADTADVRLLVPGREWTFSGFGQLKHTFADELTLNAGARFDLKQRRPGDEDLGIEEQDDITSVSPRVALIWSPAEVFSTKISWADAFVDAPYWYRYTTLASYAGAISLAPERLRAIQLTPEVTVLDGRLRNTLNLAYNDLYDSIYRDNNADPAAGEPFYRNAASLRSVVLEEEVAFVEEGWQVRANGTVQRPLAVENYPADASGTRLANVPSVVANGIVDVNVLQPLDRKGWVDLAVRFVGPQYAPILATSIDLPDAEANLANELAAYALLDAGLRLEELTQWLSVDARVYNLLDQDYAQGGSTLFPYPQPGRWFLVNVEIHARP